VPVDANNDGVVDLSNNIRTNGTRARLFSPASGWAIMSMEGGAGGYSAIDFRNGAAPAWGAGKNDAGNFYIDYTGIPNVFTILAANQYVGIGVAPAAITERLTVAGRINAQPPVAGNVNNVVTLGYANSNYVNEGQANSVNSTMIEDNSITINDLAPSAKLWDANGNHIYNTNTGNVGIGTNNPRFPLEINGRIVNTAAYGANANLGSYDVGVGSVGASTVYGYSAICTGNAAGNCAGASGTVLGVANGAAQNNIPNGGNVFFNRAGGNLGVGLTNPAAKLDILGDLKVGINAFTYIIMRDDESPNGVKYIHANSNVAGFLNGFGNWMAYWDNSGNMRNVGTITATGDVCTDLAGGKCLSSGGGNPVVTAEQIVTVPSSSCSSSINLGAHDFCMLTYTDFRFNEDQGTGASDRGYCRITGSTANWVLTGYASGQPAACSGSTWGETTCGATCFDY
jgi:hypothetical protein